MIAHPNTSQTDRDLLADIVLANLGVRAGTGDSAEHDDEVVTS